MTDIGIGDVVEATSDMPDSGVSKGDRDIVRALWVGEGICRGCGEFSGKGLVLAGHEPAGGAVSWHTCGWRKVGGSQADTIRRIRERLQNIPSVEYDIPIGGPL